MKATVIAIAISTVVGGAVGSAATAITIPYAATSPAASRCPQAAKDNATKRFFTPPTPLPTTGYATYGAKSYP